MDHTYFPTSASVPEGDLLPTAEDFQSWLTSSKGVLWNTATTDLTKEFSAHRHLATVWKWNHSLHTKHAEIAADPLVHTVFLPILCRVCVFVGFARISACHPWNV